MTLELLDPGITPEMWDWFQQRTKKHIALVAKYCRKIHDLGDPRFEGILDRIDLHDQTKFEEPERTPYVYTTWMYKCKADGVEFTVPEEIGDKMHKATIHHVKTNRHHAEFFDPRWEVINRVDRDKPPEGRLIDGTTMGDLDVAEMVADWCAMSEERGGNPSGWADMNLDVRWKFIDAHKQLIYELIEEIF